jgi:hypothetical protein
VIPILCKSDGSSQPRLAEKFARYDVFLAGAVAEWLGRGLQSPVQRFESAPRLRPPACRDFVFRSPESFRGPLHQSAPSLHERHVGGYVGYVEVTIEVESSPNAGVTHRPRERLEASAAAEPAGSERVACGVRVAVADTRLVEAPPPPAGEAAFSDRTLPVDLAATGPGVPQVRLRVEPLEQEQLGQPLPEPPGHWDNPVFAAFAGDHDELAGVDLEPPHLNSCPSGLIPADGTSSAEAPFWDSS